MTSPEAERKLTAVFVTDVAGYSRLMGDDHDATVKTLSDYRAVFSDYIQQYKGRVVNAPGDSILAEFGSVVNAVTAAVEIQRELAERNEKLSDQRRMHFRIGVNLGDVLIKDGELFGDGVNIAARLESLADPGGVCISRTVYDQVHTRLDLEYDYLGEHKVKNIATPVRAYKVLLEPGQAPTRTERAARKLARSWRKAALAATVAVLVALVAVLAWNQYRQSAIDSALAAFEKEAAFPLPDQPSIAVLAFDNMSGDPAQEYFSDGLSENIIARLARLSGMLVIARNSSFKYKGQQIDVRQVGRELGVRYVLEGSVQRAEGRIRITAQLIDAATGNHLWAETYDRRMQDVFAIQDEISRNIITELDVRLVLGEGVRFSANEFSKIETYDLYLQGTELFFRFDKAANAKARSLNRKAQDLEPRNAVLIAALGWTHLIDAGFGWVDDRAASLQQAEELARQAIAVDENHPSAYFLLSRIHGSRRQYEKAIATGLRAVELAPGDPDSNAHLAWTMLLVGNTAEALVKIKKALRLSPYPPAYFWRFAGTAFYIAGQHEDAARSCRNYLLMERQSLLARRCWRTLIASYMELGKIEEARDEAKEFLAAFPDSSITEFRKGWKRSSFKDLSFLERRLALLRKAGLPE